MNLAVSNLAWGSLEATKIQDLLRSREILGVELAPTALWPEGPGVDPASVRRQAQFWSDAGMRVTGLQSLLYGHPELQLFDQACHAALLTHLSRMVELASALGARYVVFGSPKNRVRGDLSLEVADDLAASFFHRLVPVLEREGVTVTLEPNATQYGADYLTDYESCLRLSSLVGSVHVQPQVDTGCLSMVGVDPAAAIRRRTPAHVHVSAPMLGPPPGEIDHQAVRAALDEAGYDGWCTLEMLATGPEAAFEVLTSTVDWFVATYGAKCAAAN